MKFFLILSSILFLLIGFSFWALFTFSGNDFAKPYIEKILSKKLEKDVVLETFTLKTNFIDTEMTIDKNSKVIINGTFAIFKKSFNLDYDIYSKNLNTPFVNIDGLLSLKGKVIGNIKEFSIKGEGNAFRSRVKFSSNIKNKKLKDIFINAKGLKVEDVLAFAKKPIYSKGMFDIQANITSLKDDTYKGKINALIHYGNLDNELIQRDFGVKLGQAVVYKGKIDSNIDGNILHVKSDIFSNLLEFQTRDTQYDIRNKTLYSDYKVNIPKLNSLKSIIGISLLGNMTFDGNIKKDKEDLAIDVNSNWLGGDLKAIVFNNTLKADFKNMDLQKITDMLDQPKYSNAKVSISADMQDIRQDTREGKIKLHVENGNLNANTMKDMFEFTVPKTLQYEIVSMADVQKNDVIIDTNVTSTIGLLKLPQSKFDIKNATLNGKYFLHVGDLKKVEFLTKRAMRGNLNIDGNFQVNPDSKMLNGKSDFLNARTVFTLNDDLLHIKSDDLEILQLTNMLYYPKIFDSFSNFSLDYNISNNQGVFNVIALNGKLVANSLTNIVQLASGFDLSKEIYKQSVLKGLIDKRKIDFSLFMDGFESYLKIPQGNIDLDSNEVDSNFDIKIRKKDFKGTIKGNLDKPTVKLDSSEYIKQKLDKVIDKNVPDNLKEPLKNILKLFG